jgi:spore coat polysaccharide biosynthesis protein SpsF
MRIIATIEARMTSTRLPGKVLLEARGAPLLHHLVDRLRDVPSLDGIVLATTTNRTDDVLAQFAARERIACFRGSEDDVMARVIGAAGSVEADVVVEITGDCPVIDPQIVEQTIRMFLAHDVAYASNVIVRSYPDGMDTQVFSLDTLERSAALTSERLDREHVTLHIREHPEIFSRVHLVAPPEMHWPDLGLTLDEPADYDLIRRLVEHFGDANPRFSCLDAIRVLRAHPEWTVLNLTVARKGAA